MLSFRGVSKSFGSRLLFENVTFTLGSRERVGLVGRNGHGKTTLLNIIIGAEAPDSGSIIAPKGYQVGCLAQKLSFHKNTAREEALSALPEDKRDFPYLAEKVLSGLGFTQSLMGSSPLKLSGGYQVRLNLAKLLISEPNLLLLDEPTNYLDILSVRWLRDFLLQWKGELMVITHDRTFMDSVVTHIAGIHRRQVRKIAGNTGKYYDQVALEEEVYEKTRLNDEAKRRDAEIFISRFRAKARLANMVQSRVKMLSKMEKKDRLEAIGELDFSFRYKNIPSQTVLRAENIGFAYADGKKLFSGLSFSLDKGDRLCIIGRNGAGKSTLLKVLAGRLPPSEGRILGHNDASGGYFEQADALSASHASTVEEEVAQASGFALERSAVRKICASFLFSGDDALKKIGMLSGGEKCRVMLARIVASPCSYLLLDEPTNHLDMDAADSLLEALNEYPGAVALVTHNEGYLANLATKLIVFQGDNPFIFDGTYAEFLEKIGWANEENMKKDSSAPVRKDLRRAKAALVAEKSRALKPLLMKIEELEAKIIAGEEETESVQDEIRKATDAQDGKRLVGLGHELARISAAGDALYEELNRVTVEYGAQEALFNEKIKGMES